MKEWEKAIKKDRADGLYLVVTLCAQFICKLVNGVYVARWVDLELDQASILKVIKL